MIERIPQKTGRILINIAALLFLFIPPLVRAMPDVVLAEDKQPRSAIIVAPEILTAPASDRLRASVEDLARCLRLISGADIPLLTNLPASSEIRIPVFVGALAENTFGKPKKNGASGQGWRLVVSPKGIGMIGQSDIATTYAIYELLDRLGCRWFMPGPLGEDIPVMPVLAIPELDISEAPTFASRGLCHADTDFSRRNRLYNTNQFLRATPENQMLPCYSNSIQCPAHSLLNINCPHTAALRQSFFSTNAITNTCIWHDLGYNPGEFSAPLPLMRRWSENIPFLLTNAVNSWLPDTYSSFAGSLPGFYLGCRLAWYPHARPKDVLDEFFVRFYGKASVHMREFWDDLDQAWHDTPDHSQNAWGYLRRFTPGIMARARRALEQAGAAAQTDVERRRVGLAEAMFSSFENFMRMRHDLAEGRLATLEANANAWLEDWNKLAKTHAASCAFEPDCAPACFRRFMLPTYEEASRIAANYQIITPPLRTWKWAAETNEPGETSGWPGPDFKDSEWNTTDSCVDTWSAMGVSDQTQTVWYRLQITEPMPQKPKKILLWLSAVEGSIRCYINGRPVPEMHPQPNEAAAVPVRGVSFDLTKIIKPDQRIQISFAITKNQASPGSAGLYGPAYLCQDP